MDSIRLKNYRSIEDSHDVAIKPLTFLLGANSSGKSSFLKIFPLIKQSIDSNVRGTFLWNGNLVDFKDFQNVVRNGEGNIIVSFVLSNIKIVKLRSWETKESIGNCNVSLEISKVDDRWDYLKTLDIIVENETLKICYGYKQGTHIIEDILINGESCIKLGRGVRAIAFTSLIPRVYYKMYEGMDDVPYFINIELFELLHLDNDTDKHLIVRRFISDSPAFIFNGQDITKLFERRFKTKWGFDDTETKRIKKLLLYANINTLIDSINSYISAIANKITYVAPLRANFERYYRFQNYSVNTIDSDGRNLAMFLNSLSRREMEDFNNWLSDVFKISVRLTPSVGHVAIELKEKDNEFRNLVDLGFGYTEMLPILAMIWKDVEYDNNLSNRDNDVCKKHIFAMEQPELHLHPRFQAKFARLLVNVVNKVKNENRDIRFIIETHSDVIINKIGELISERKCNCNDVNVVLFNAEHEGLNNYVESTSFSEDGYIINWPYGFFEEEYDAD